MMRTASFPEDREAIDALLAAVAEADGVQALSEEPRRDLATGPRRPGLVATDGARLIGYVHLLHRRGGLAAEIAIHPKRREEVAAFLVRAAAETAGRMSLRLWAKDEPTAAAAVEAGFAEGRTMLRLERPLPLPQTAGFEGEARVVPFRPCADERALLMVSNEAFAGHPDSGDWDPEVLADRMARDWFDPAGLFLAWERGRPVGLCWTKVHPGRLGEIYSVAVRPDAAGRGLGRALTLVGLGYLSSRRGATRAMLYTETANSIALGLYRSLGFAISGSAREYVLGE